MATANETTTVVEETPAAAAAEANGDSKPKTSRKRRTSTKKGDTASSSKSSPKKSASAKGKSTKGKTTTAKKSTTKKSKEDKSRRKSSVERILEALEAAPNGLDRNGLREATGIQKGYSKLLGSPTKEDIGGMEGDKLVKSKKEEGQAGFIYTITAKGKKELKSLQSA